MPTDALRGNGPAAIQQSPASGGVDTFAYRGRSYPEFQRSGFAARFAFPYAREVCKGIGYDIGCGKLEWAFPGSIPIDVSIGDDYEAKNLPPGKIVDYIFSSHCLEHLDDWVGALIYWTTRLRSGGTLFLYLPHYHQEYWRPWNNRKHSHVLTARVVADCLEAIGYRDVFRSGRDLNDSFMVFGCKI